MWRLSDSQVIGLPSTSLSRAPAIGSGLAGGRVGDPELDAVVDVAGESDLLAVVGPFRSMDGGALRAARRGARAKRQAAGCSDR